MCSMNPDQCAAEATKLSMSGLPRLAFAFAVASIRSRGEWVMVNGQWVNRASVMRRAHADDHLAPYGEVCLCQEGVILRTPLGPDCTNCGDQWA